MSEHPVVTNPTPGSVDAPASTTDVKAVRAWALENVEGFTATRGRIAAEVQKAYDEAHQERVKRPELLGTTNEADVQDKPAKVFKGQGAWKNA